MLEGDASGMAAVSHTFSSTDQEPQGGEREF